MSALKTMLQYGGSSGTVNVDTMAVYATNVDDQNNSGCCCLWTVPAGVTWFSVEMWGGGGGGAGSCCCQFGTPGGAGSYSRKIINTTAPGQTYRFCAAGSTYCSQDCGNGCDAYPTYVYGTTEAVNIACASGGHRGCNFCWGAIGTTYMGCSSHLCGSWCGGFGFCGAMGAQKGTAFCSGTAYSWAPTAPFVGNFFRPSIFLSLRTDWRTCMAVVASTTCVNIKSNLVVCDPRSEVMLTSSRTRASIKSSQTAIDCE